MRRKGTRTEDGGGQPPNHPAIQPPSHPASHGGKRKVRVIEVRKAKRSGTQGKRVNLRKVGKKQVKLRPGFYM